ncbi:MAG TPA: hydrolase, partial [Flavisolibacter sp.]|nr:hydrolase [Flavisolibacter sp.]
MNKKHFLLSLLSVISGIAFAQKKNDDYQLNIHKTALPIKIDGAGDEEAWKESEVAKDFFMVLPMDTSFARVRTEVRMTYDDQNLYLLATCYNALPGPYFVESLRRD